LTLISMLVFYLFSVFWFAKLVLLNNIGVSTVLLFDVVEIFVSELTNSIAIFSPKLAG